MGGDEEGANLKRALNIEISDCRRKVFLKGRKRRGEEGRVEGGMRGPEVYNACYTSI